MWVWYNDKLLPKKELILHPDNRAFQYGDGIFETIIIRNGEMVHAAYHEKRIMEGTNILHLDFKLSFADLQKRIQFLLKKNKINEARAKLIIWRAPGGYYIPETRKSEFLISIKKYKEPDTSPQQLGISKNIRLPKGLTQNCKTLNSLPYILAGLELNERTELNDLILLDFDGNVSECISSNLFWVKDGKYYTPSLETNCVSGIKRAFVIDKLREKDQEVIEILATPEDVMGAEFVFKTNVTGIFPVRSIEDHHFEINPDLMGFAEEQC